MPTPAIQTLVTDAQQVLNLSSISAVRATVAVALANANTGTPLNPNLTTQQLWDQFYQVVTQPKSDIESIIANQLMKFLYAPPAPGGVGADKQVIFNDGGTLAGDADFIWNKTTNLLTVTGAATITGDLTVDTSTLKVDSANDRVGIGTASPAQFVHLSKSSTSTALTAPPVGGASLRIQNTSSTNNNFGSVEFYNANGLFGGSVNCQFTNQATPTNDLVFVTRGSSGGLEHYRIAADGVCTWSEVGGVAGTAMTLNSTGLGIGASPVGRLNIANTGADVVTSMTAVGVQRWQFIVSNSTAAFSIYDQTNSGTRLLIDTSGNVGVGVTPSAWGSSYKAIQVAANGVLYANGSNSLFLGGNYYNDSGGTNRYLVSNAATAYGQVSGAHQWYTAPSGTAGNAITFTQAMTLDASGNLLVGTTNSASNAGIGLKASYSATAPYYATVGSSNASNAYSYLLYSTTDAAFKFYVSYSGTVSATNGTISAISDARLKENVQDIDVGLGAILALKPRKFDWKEGKGKNIKGDRGFIAQEFEQVFPNLVDEWKDNAPEGEVPYKSVRQDLIPVLVKAIQELTARVAALEA